MEGWLIDKAIARNIPPDQIIDVQSVSGTGNTGSGGSGDGSVFMQGLFADVKGAAKEFFDMMALDPVEVEENIESCYSMKVSAKVIC